MLRDAQEHERIQNRAHSNLDEAPVDSDGFFLYDVDKPMLAYSFQGMPSTRQVDL